MIKTSRLNLANSPKKSAFWPGVRYSGRMKLSRLWLVVAAVFCGLVVKGATEAEERGGKVVYIIPIRDDINPPMAYLVRRGVKEAMAANADLLVLDMETNGGRVDTTEQIIKILGQFKGQTATYVNEKAFSAGAFISVATQKIFMAPQSVIGAAAPILMGTGGGAEKVPDTVEAKMTSGVRALVRTQAEKNGYNVQVIEAMIDKTRELKIGDEVINEKGQILTLTNVQAEKEYGDPPKPLLSSGTVGKIEEVIEKLGFAGAKVTRVEPLGAEVLGSWLSRISPLLMLIGIVGIYIEMKTPGFGLPGIIGISAFALYFVSSYIAGLAGLEWLVVFVIGLALVILEIMVFPGTLILGLGGGALMIMALVMALVDLYPGMPRVPSMPQLEIPLVTVFGTLSVGTIIAALLSRYLLKTTMFNRLVSRGASGEQTSVEIFEEQTARVGQEGVTICALRPGGKADFGGQLLDVLSQGEMLPKGTRVRIVGFSGREAIVEAIAS